MSNANLPIGLSGIYLHVNSDGNIEAQNRPDGVGSFVNLIAKYPSKADHLATKSYVDASLAGIVPTKILRAASVENLTTLIYTLEAGDTLDGILLNVGDSILLKDQLDLKQKWRLHSSSIWCTSAY